MSVAENGGGGSLPPVIFKSAELAVRGMCSKCEAEQCWQNYMVIAKCGFYSKKEETKLWG